MYPPWCTSCAPPGLKTANLGKCTMWNSLHSSLIFRQSTRPIWKFDTSLISLDATPFLKKKLPFWKAREKRDTGKDKLCVTLWNGKLTFMLLRITGSFRSSRSCWDASTKCISHAVSSFFFKSSRAVWKQKHGRAMTAQIKLSGERGRVKFFAKHDFYLSEVCLTLKECEFRSVTSGSCSNTLNATSLASRLLIACNIETACGIYFETKQVSDFIACLSELNSISQLEIQYNTKMFQIRTKGRDQMLCGKNEQITAYLFFSTKRENEEKMKLELDEPSTHHTKLMKMSGRVKQLCVWKKHSQYKAPLFAHTFNFHLFFAFFFFFFFFFLGGGKARMSLERIFWLVASDNWVLGCQWERDACWNATMVERQELVRHWNGVMSSSLDVLSGTVWQQEMETYHILSLAHLKRLVVPCAIIYAQLVTQFLTRVAINFPHVCKTILKKKMSFCGVKKESCVSASGRNCTAKQKPNKPALLPLSLLSAFACSLQWKSEGNETISTFVSKDYSPSFAKRTFPTKPRETAKFQNLLREVASPLMRYQRGGGGGVPPHIIDQQDRWYHLW